MEKVRLPKEVADAIEKWTDKKDHERLSWAIANTISCPIHQLTSDAVTIREYFADGKWFLLMQALVNGYEVEQTPEEKIAEYYKGAIMKIGKNAPNGAVMEAFGEGQIQAIHFILRTLGLEIDGIPVGWKEEGVNA